MNFLVPIVHESMLKHLCVCVCVCVCACACAPIRITSHGAKPPSLRGASKLWNLSDSRGILTTEDKRGVQWTTYT